MRYIVGIDEVGRGALAGPVVVAAVLLKDESILTHLAGIFPKGLRDSKAATLAQRQKVDNLVRTHCIFGIGLSEATVIDGEGIVAATTQAAGRALEGIMTKETAFTVEADAGLFHPYEHIFPTARTVKADETILPVLLASHVAKVYRDNLMRTLAQEYNQYGWQTNVGYGSQAHMSAIKEHGLSPQHRQSFLKRL